MNRVFNMGIGMVLVVSPHFVDSIQHQLSDMGMTSWKLGTAIAAHEEEDRVVLCE